MNTSTVVKMDAYQRHTTLGRSMAEDFNLRMEDRGDIDRTIAAAFFLSWAILPHLVEVTFLAFTGMEWKHNATGQKILTYNPPIEGVNLTKGA